MSTSTTAPVRPATPVTDRASVVVVAAFDSQLKWSSGIRDELVARGTRVEAVAPRDHTALSPQQVHDAGYARVETLEWSEVVARCAAADVVVCALAGPRVRRLTIELDALGLSPGPVVVAGWVGVIIEKITAGYLDRCGADVVAVNARHELEHFADAARLLAVPTENLVLSGLPFLSTAPQPQRTGPVRTVLFADQPTVPGGPTERLHLYRRLVDHARLHPERRVLLKPRHRLGEDTYHRMHHHPVELLAETTLPPNLEIVYDPITSLLDEVDLLVTVSSTACLEAIDAGCRVALVLDLGVHERLGNHVFLDSGLLRTFDQIDADDLGTPADHWVDSYFGGRDAPAPRVIADRVEELLGSGTRPSRTAQRSAYLRAAAELHDAQEAGSLRPPSPLSRRRHRYGTVGGTIAHLAALWLPPFVMRHLGPFARRTMRRT